MIERAPSAERPVRAPEPDPRPTNSLARRRARARRFLIRYLVGVGLPTLLAIVYYGFLAAPQYDSTAVVALGSSLDPFSANLSKEGTKDVKLLRAYLRSPDLFARVDGEQHLVDHYRGARDPLARLGKSEDPVPYFEKMFLIEHDPKSNGLKLIVRAFSAQDAERFARAIVAAADAKVSELSQAARQRVLDVAEQRVAQARNHPEQPATIDAALAALEKTRGEVALQQTYLMTIASPTQPAAASHPRPAWGIATVFVASLLAVAVLSLLGGAVREHAQF